MPMVTLKQVILANFLLECMTFLTSPTLEQEKETKSKIKHLNDKKLAEHGMRTVVSVHDVSSDDNHIH